MAAEGELGIRGAPAVTRGAHPDAVPHSGVNAAADRSRQRWGMLAGVSLASFLLTLSDSGLAVALPAVGRHLELSLSGLEWVVNAYTLALSVFLLAAGRLTDLLGGRRVFLAGIGLFAATSLLAGLAHSGGLLLTGRALQGVAAALVMPAALALVSGGFSAGGRGLALGIWSGAGAAALALGPLAGALVTEQLGWAWIFLANVPLAALALLAAQLTLPPSPPLQAGGVDVAGLASSAAALTTLVVALTEANRLGWNSPIVLGSLAAAVVATAVFVWIELRQTRPLVDLRRLATRTVGGANMVMLLSTAVMCSVLFFVSLYLQSGRGYSPIATGAAFLPMTLLILLTAPVAGRLSDRFGARAPTSAGMLVIAAGLTVLSELGFRGGFGWLLPSLAAVGLGVGLVTTPLTDAGMSDSDERNEGVAAGVINTSRMIGLTLGIALMGAIVAARWPGGFAAASDNPGALASGLALAYRINAGIALAGAALALLTLSGHRPQAATERVSGS